MYSVAKKLAAFSFILCIANAVFTVLYIILMIGQHLPFPEMFTKVCYSVTGTGVLVLATVAIRSLCADLELEYDARSRQLREQNEHIKKLEEKIKYLEK